jgi:hypothetical protein
VRTPCFSHPRRNETNGIGHRFDGSLVARQEMPALLGAGPLEILQVIGLLRSRQLVALAGVEADRHNFIFLPRRKRE